MGLDDVIKKVKQRAGQFKIRMPGRRRCQFCVGQISGNGSLLCNYGDGGIGGKVNMRMAGVKYHCNQ